METPVFSIIPPRAAISIISSATLKTGPTLEIIKGLRERNALKALELREGQLQWLE